jgi:hypothetical protein
MGNLGEKGASVSRSTEVALRGALRAQRAENQALAATLKAVMQACEHFFAFKLEEEGLRKAIKDSNTELAKIKKVSPLHYTLLRNQKGPMSVYCVAICSYETPPAMHHFCDLYILCLSSCTIVTQICAISV